jgi:alcohol dehydrogenase class IV
MAPWPVGNGGAVSKPFNMTAALQGNWSLPTQIWSVLGRLAELPQDCRALDITRPVAVIDPGIAGLSFVTAARVGGHDGIIAIGGGSAMDTTKAIALMAGQSRPLMDFVDIGDNWRRVDAAAILPVISVPTTAGTDSEVGSSAVVTEAAS